MKTRYILLATAFALFVSDSHASQRDVQDIFRELEGTINWQLENEDWHEASKAYIRAIWNDFKSAYTENRQDLSLKPGPGRHPDAQDYDEFVGKYAAPRSAENPLSLEITKTPEGRFLVKFQGHEYPAVAVNRTIVFVTGFVSHSPMPKLGKSPYAELNFKIVVRYGGRYYMHSPGTPAGKENRLVKQKTQ